MQGRGLFDRLGLRQQAILDTLARGEDFGIDQVLATAQERQLDYRRR